MCCSDLSTALLMNRDKPRSPVPCLRWELNKSYHTDSSTYRIRTKAYEGLAGCIRFLIKHMWSWAAAECCVSLCSSSSYPPHGSHQRNPSPRAETFFALYVWLHYAVHPPLIPPPCLELEKQVPWVGVGVESRPFPPVSGMLLMRWGNGFPPTVLTCTLRINQAAVGPNQSSHLSSDPTAISLALFMGFSLLFWTPPLPLKNAAIIPFSFLSQMHPLSSLFFFCFFFSCKILVSYPLTHLSWGWDFTFSETWMWK